MKTERYIPAPPVGPGQVLRKRILSPKNITQDQLADAMQVSRLSINQIVNGKRSVTAEMALRLARVTSTTPDFWLNLQRDVDLYYARLELGDLLEKLSVLSQPKTDAELFSDAGPDSDDGWLADVRRYIEKIGKKEFTLDDVYRYEEELAKLHTRNHHVRDKIRQQLQVLRDEGFLDFVRPGVYRLR